MKILTIFPIKNWNILTYNTKFWHKIDFFFVTIALVMTYGIGAEFAFEDSAQDSFVLNETLLERELRFGPAGRHRQVQFDFAALFDFRLVPPFHWKPALQSTQRNHLEFIH